MLKEKEAEVDKFSFQWHVHIERGMRHACKTVGFRGSEGPVHFSLDGRIGLLLKLSLR
jgi:hypothetical protein